jgi:hypothetical protein
MGTPIRNLAAILLVGAGVCWWLAHFRFDVAAPLAAGGFTLFVVFAKWVFGKLPKKYFEKLSNTASRIVLESPRTWKIVALAGVMLALLASLWGAAVVSVNSKATRIFVYQSPRNQDPGQPVGVSKKSAAFRHFTGWRSVPLLVREEGTPQTRELTLRPLRVADVATSSTWKSATPVVLIRPSDDLRVLTPKRLELLVTGADGQTRSYSVDSYQKANRVWLGAEEDVRWPVPAADEQASFVVPDEGLVMLSAGDKITARLFNKEGEHKQFSPDLTIGPLQNRSYSEPVIGELENPSGGGP